MATTVLCSTIGPSAPSYPAHVRIVHPFQGGDERLMHHDRPLSAIVSRFTVRIAHSLQDGDDHLMQYDRPLSAIVPSSCSARPSLPGWRRTSYASRSAPQRHRVLIHGSDRPFPPGWRRPSYAVRSAPQRHHTQLTFSSSIPSRVATNVLCITIGPSAPSCPDSRFGSPIPSRMATTVLCSTIGPSAPSYPAHVRIAHSFQGWRRTSYAARSAPLCHRVWLMFGSPIPSRMATNISYAARSAPLCHRVCLMFGSPIPSRMATNISYAARLPLGADMPG
ncbi:unnamed protein product [Cuscuta epithymum]|uniref:Uncharacterized protein n=1 Tax=Cuscuta epithymum TaxID=186058 RepID=A0AAV0G8B2_9ASTE|nr:unnamed protein product [Cuscuta epithymum]